jgi:hypothetical protein
LTAAGNKIASLRQAYGLYSIGVAVSRLDLDIKFLIVFFLASDHLCGRDSGAKGKEKEYYA